MIKPVEVAVFPVGGLGTRFLPATKSIPKEMLPVVDKPLIQYAYEQAKEAGIKQFIFITGRNKNTITNHFDHAFELQKVLDEKEKKAMLSQVKDWLPEAGNIAFIRQQEPKGLGHAIYCAHHFIGDRPFAVLLADEMYLSEKPFMKSMVDIHNQYGGNVIGVGEVSEEKVSSYGIVAPSGATDGDYFTIKGMVEKPKSEDAPSRFSISGQYILQPEIFHYIEQAKAGKDGEIQLTDALNAMVKDVPTRAVPFRGMRFDCGNKQGFLAANIAFALSRKDMREETLETLKTLVNQADDIPVQ